MRCLRFFLLVVLTCFIGDIQAQTGCFTAGGNQDLYTMSGTVTTTSTCGTGTEYYSDTQTMYNKPAGCGWIPLSTSGTCLVHTSLGNLCGIKGLYILSCPIDSSILVLLFVAGCLGFYFITGNSKNKLKSFAEQ
jgi:hypothetical protein